MKKMVMNHNQNPWCLTMSRKMPVEYLARVIMALAIQMFYRNYDLSTEGKTRHQSTTFSLFISLFTCKYLSSLLPF